MRVSRVRKVSSVACQKPSRYFPDKGMLSGTKISRNLTELSSRYSANTGNSRDPFYYSKLALIELCGWIEQSMDAIALDCARRHLKSKSNMNYIESSIRRTYSFTYKDHFREMLIQVIGIINVEELERMVDPRKFDAMKTSLGYLKSRRDSLAHTYIDQVTTSVDAPSLVNFHFQNVFDGLEDIERCVRRLNV